MKKWILKNEQVILFCSVIIYLIGFMAVFNEEMRTTDWMGLIWVIQFFGLGIFVGLRSLKKGWSWPSRY